MWRWVKRVMVVGMLLLSSAIAVLWVRSYFVMDNFTYLRCAKHDSTLRSGAIGFHWGGVMVEYERASRAALLSPVAADRTEFGHAQTLTPGYPRVSPFEYYLSPFQYYWEYAGFGWEHVRSFGYNSIKIIVPFWFLLLLTSVLPAIVGVRYVRRRRREGRRGFPVGMKGDQEKGPQKSR